jgi:hypothetical protein
MFYGLASLTTQLLYLPPSLRSGAPATPSLARLATLAGGGLATRSPVTPLAHNRGARLVGMLISVPSVLVSTSYRVPKPVHLFLLRRRARLLAAQAVPVFVASQGGPINVKGSARLFSLAYRCGLGWLLAFLPPRRRASPSPILAWPLHAGRPTSQNPTPPNPAPPPRLGRSPQCL